MIIKTTNQKSISPALRRRMALPFLLSLQLMTGECAAITLEELAAKVERLEAENRVLKEQMGKLTSGAPAAVVPAAATHVAAPAAVAGLAAAAAPVRAGNSVGFDGKLSFQMLDPTTDINRKQLLLLDARRRGELPDSSLTLGGAITAVVDRQSTSTNGSFGYLMRQPGNAIGRSASEAVIHSAQLGLTATIGTWVTAYSELLYGPSQSFAAGINTAETRNQVQLRSGYVVLGNLDRSPFYASIGKMATPFGLTDTVSPFSASTVWHAFGGLANGLQGGYSSGGLNASLMAVQGGAQFRGANTPVDGTNVPSKLNNLAIDASYTWNLADTARLRTGASYERGSSYCQPFPVSHFGACQTNNPAYDLYARMKSERWTLQAEYARTANPWPGTFNPALPQFTASKVTSWGLGGRYLAQFGNQNVFLSAEASRLVSGPGGAPWEKQDQIVLGAAAYLSPSVKLFGELVRVNGFVPLQNVGTINANAGARSNVILMGVNAAY